MLPSVTCFRLPKYIKLKQSEIGSRSAPNSQPHPLFYPTTHDYACLHDVIFFFLAFPRICLTSHAPGCMGPSNHYPECQQRVAHWNDANCHLVCKYDYLLKNKFDIFVLRDTSNKPAQVTSLNGMVILGHGGNNSLNLDISKC